MRHSDRINNTLSKIHDKQIFSNKHDEILMWLCKNINDDPAFLLNESADVSRLFDDIVDRALGCYARRTKPASDYSDESTYVLDYINKDKLKCDYLIENPVMSGHSPVGFVDLTVLIGALTSKYYIDGAGQKSDETVDFSHYMELNIEIKTEVNIGETLRQINYYKAKGGRKSIWAVCAPPFNGSEMLTQQGISFIPYT